MTREEAIKVLETEIALTCKACKPTVCTTPCRYVIAMRMAIEAINLYDGAEIELTPVKVKGGEKE